MSLLLKLQPLIWTIFIFGIILLTMQTVSCCLLVQLNIVLIIIAIFAADTLHVCKCASLQESRTQTSYTKCLIWFRLEPSAENMEFCTRIEEEQTVTLLYANHNELIFSLSSIDIALDSQIVAPAHIIHPGSSACFCILVFVLHDLKGWLIQPRTDVTSVAVFLLFYCFSFVNLLDFDGEIWITLWILWCSSALWLCG